MAVGITDEIQPRPVAGVRIGVAELGGRTRPRADLTLVELAPGSTCVAVFTQSAFCAAPVTVAKEHLATADARYWLINAGNANAGTGRQGVADARATCKLVAGLSGCKSEQVLPFSTGVIGEFMDLDKFEAALPTAYAGLGRDNWEAGGRAIMTTDTVAKAFSTRFEASGVEYGVTGIAKGSGMIRPDMATMLAFVFTDLSVYPPLLQSCLAESVERSFNRITVDSDTSTSDTVLLFATGEQIDEDLVADDDPRFPAFRGALDGVLLDLAHQIVRDGEGASKFVAVTVTGAADDGAAKRIAMAIAESPLVKTALAAEDANWGRVVMAVGKAGEAADRDRLEIWIGTEQVTADGQVLAGYSEERATEHLRADEIEVRVDVGVGDGAATVWTCDLTHGYIEINAGYRS